MTSDLLAEPGFPFHDTADVDAARRGYLGGADIGAITSADGRVVWDSGTYAFLDGECPATVHPSLWRQSRLVREQGLFEVTAGIYQVRGLDLSNMTLVEGATGVIVIDPLISAETAAAALKLYREHRGDKPVTGVIYTHSHVDHFGGVRGVTTSEDVAAGRCPILAPEGFMEHAISENLFAGTAMARRAAYMYGAALDRGPEGQVGAGLGQTTSTGTVTLIPPTLDVTHTGQEETVDGVRIVFQVTPGTEAPAEMNFFFPDRAALCMAENATHTLHNTLTLRGALVRDPHVWARYLTEAVALFGDQADVLFASHHWPTWGRAELAEFISEQRDLYAYLHDQTLRMLNQGYVGAEIAERFQMPPTLEAKWHTHGYYGSVSHNVKAVYQRYMGWFDGNPAHLWQHPPAAAAQRYVEAIGGASEVVKKARTAFEAGDYRWAAELANHAVFADEGDTAAKELQAEVFTALGYGCENGPWRNFFLAGAAELRRGSMGTPTDAAPPDFMLALTPGQLFEAMSFTVDGPRAWDARIVLDWTITDAAEGHRFHRMTLRNGVLVNEVTDGTATAGADAAFVMTSTALLQLLGKQADLSTLIEAGDATVTGDPTALGTLIGLLDEPDADFAMVTPGRE